MPDAEFTAWWVEKDEKLAWSDPAGAQFFRRAIARTDKRGEGVVTWMPLVRGLLLSVKTVRTWPVPSVAIFEQGVTALAAPKAPVKSVPPSPRAPPVTNASSPVGRPTESKSPLTPPSSPRLRRYAPWLDGPPSTGLIPKTL